jgi:hypothetical protein
MNEILNSVGLNQNNTSKVARLMSWLAVIFVAYILSAGPVAMMDGRGCLGFTTSRAVSLFYKPFALFYEHTFLHRPLGMYLHLWSGNQYDDEGDRNGEETHAPTN